MRVDGENLGTAPIERVLLRHPDVLEAAVYPIPDPAVGDRVMAALVLVPGATFDCERFHAFLDRADRPGPQAAAGVRADQHRAARTETFKVLKRVLSAEALDCADQIVPIRGQSVRGCSS